MIVLIIEIDGFYEQVLLTGRKCTKQELRKMYFQTKELVVEPSDFSAIFCRMHDFEKIKHIENIKIDYVLDTDTDINYSPS